MLGELRDKSLMHVVTEVDPATGAFSPAMPTTPSSPTGSPSSTAASPTRTVTGDRTEFLGRNGTLADPAALRPARLSGKVGAGLDPCAAMQVPFELADGQEREIVFILGAGRDIEEARQSRSALPQHRRPPAQALRSRLAITGTARSARCTSKRPIPSVNFLANGWLLYQTLACRMWARTGFYQSGGAFGFRDQLQDAMALVHAEPGLLREHLLRAPPINSAKATCSTGGIRPSAAACARISPTTISGCPLPPAAMSRPPATPACSTNASLSSKAAPLKPEEEAYYDLPVRSDSIATLYEHCVARHRPRPADSASTACR